MGTIKLNAVKSAYARRDNPNTHYSTSASGMYYLRGLGPNDFLLFKFASMPNNLRHNKIYGGDVGIQLRVGESTAKIQVNLNDFNPDTVTYASAPDLNSYYDIVFQDSSHLGQWRDFASSSNALYPSTTRRAILYGMTVSGDLLYNEDDTKNWYGKIVLSNGDPAYLQVAYDDNVKIPSKVQLVSGPSGNNHSTLATKYFSWKYVKNSSDYCADETWAQASAKIWWKPTDSSTWRSINISGTTTSYTAPAETFPAGKTIEYYIQGTDEDGTTTYTGTSSFSTASASLVLNNYPSGSGVYSGQALSFTWDILENNASHTQASAVLYWKRQSASSYEQLSVSGNTKRITAAANTFPSGTTVEWYVTVVDKAGVSYTSASKTFTTAAPTVRMVTYPSGSNINYGAVIPFTWELASTAGTYAQASAVFYWRANTSDPWSSINISGGTKGINVPAYTFPSNKTINFYVSATDTGGSTSSTSAMSFKTASPVIVPQDSPTSGYADPRNAITFRWFFTDGANSYDQQSAALKWRVSGQSAWNTVSASGTTQSVTVAANTFPTLSNIEWMLTGTVRGGTSSETEIYTFSTTASTAYAVCQSPVGRAEDGSKDIVFRWTVRNSDGSEPSRVVVRWKKTTEAATEWRTVLDESDAVYELTMPAGTFPAGGIDWQVTAYNRDSVAGPASVASFVCMVAPDAPQGLTATAVPRTTISWQATGQEAYQIEINGEVVQASYGPDVTSWRKEEPLEDGVYSIRVRIQGAYGLWSDWAETSISVVNVPDGEIALTGKFRVDGVLHWTYDGVGDPETVAIYRDGKWIGTATGKTAFTDRFVLGDHEYRVEYWFADGNYTRSNVCSGCMSSEVLRIAELSGGDWMPLKYSESSDRKQKYSWSKQSALHTVTGSLWPVLETAPYESLSANYDCAFTEIGCVRKFEQLRGKIVILKGKGGNVLIGGLIATDKTVGNFFTTFSFSVRQCHWEDFVHDDAND